MREFNADGNIDDVDDVVSVTVDCKIREYPHDVPQKLFFWVLFQRELTLQSKPGFSSRLET